MSGENTSPMLLMDRPEDSNNEHITRQHRREKKLRKQKERMQKHGKGLAQIYRDAILKRQQPSQQNKREA